MKCINAEVLKYHIKSRTKEGQKKVSLSTVMDIIDRQTPVPLESVVHCKDCKYYNSIGVCIEMSSAVCEDSFCCWAERKENG